MKEFLSNAVSVLLVAGAACVLALVARREFTDVPARAAIAPVPDRAVSEWKALVEGNTLGNPAAPVQIVEFSDFQCAFCNRVRPELARIQAMVPDSITVVYRHFVREQVKPAAFAAAMASECAGEQGRFKQFHDILFKDQAAIGKMRWAAVARTAGVPDVEAFERCVEEQRFRARVERDTRAAEAIGVPGTPAFVFAGRLIVGVSAPARLEPLIREALAAP